VRSIERQTRAEIRTFPAQVQCSALSRVAIDLARRLDDAPADTAAVLLARELRMAMADLRARCGDDVGHELEQFLGRVRAEEFDAGH